MSRSCIECAHNNPNDPSDLAYACLNCSWPPFAGEPTNFKPKPITNYDRLRAKSVEEMAEFISGKARTFGEEYEGYMSALDWLKMEVSE